GRHSCLPWSFVFPSGYWLLTSGFYLYRFDTAPAPSDHLAPNNFRRTQTMLLTKHEGETFLNQTVYISGQAFIRCNFVACTLVLRETVYHLEGCTFERCNWHVDWVLMWGSPESLREIKALVNMIEQAQQQQLPPDQMAAGAQRAPQSPATQRQGPTAAPKIQGPAPAPKIAGVKPPENK